MYRILYMTLPLLALMFASIANAHAPGIGNFTPQGPYPVNTSYSSCSVYQQYIYCVGGFNGQMYQNGTYFASISSSGIGNWTGTRPYPLNASGIDCNINGGYIYCVGGNGIDFPLNYVGFAKLGSSGISGWTGTTPYPLLVYGRSCVVYGGYIYCVGGTDHTGKRYANTYYAQILASGIGNWQQTSSYPLEVSGESCNIDNNYIYCIGGWAGDKPVTASYYAQLSPQGISTWTATTPYPLNITGQSCSISNDSNIYCTGGYNTVPNESQITYFNNSYYAPIGTSGIGPWNRTTQYPYPSAGASCNIYDEHLFCIGGDYYGLSTPIVAVAPLSGAKPITTASTTILQVSTSISTLNTTSTIANSTAVTKQHAGTGYALYAAVIIVIVIIVAAYLYMRRNAPRKKPSAKQ